MNCFRAKKAIHLYIDGYLAAEREEELFVHLDNCPDCRQYYDDMLLIYDNLEEPEREVPYGFSDAWQEELEVRGGKKRIVNYKVLIPAFAACVCGLFVMSAVVLGANNNRITAEGEVPVVESAEQRPAFEIRELDDGIKPVATAQPGTTVNDVGILEEEISGGQAQTNEGSPAENNIMQNGADAQPSASQAAAAPANIQSAPAPSQGGKAAMMAANVIDATGKPYRQELIDFAKQNNVKVTENASNSVTLEADPGVINTVLANFQLGQVTDTNIVEIVF